jgi:hypothetical protein
MSSFAIRYRPLLIISVALAVIVCWRVSSPGHALAAAALLMGSQAKLASTGDEAGSNDNEAAPSDRLKIGGQPVVQLKRKSSANAARPEFTSVTVLPGRGMNLFQIPQICLARERSMSLLPLPLTRLRSS